MEAGILIEVRDARRRRWTQVNNEFLRNPGMSSGAKTVLSVYLSFQPQYRPNSCVALTKYTKEGVTSVRSSMNELIEHGYAIRRKIHHDQGHWQQVIWMSDCPDDIAYVRDQVEGDEPQDAALNDGVTQAPESPDSGSVLPENRRTVLNARTQAARARAEATQEHKTSTTKTKRLTTAAPPAAPAARRDKQPRRVTSPPEPNGRSYGAPPASRRRSAVRSPDSPGGLADRFVDLVRQHALDRTPEDIESGALASNLKQKISRGDTPDGIRALQDAWFASQDSKRSADGPQWKRFINAMHRLRDGTSNGTSIKKRMGKADLKMYDPARSVISDTVRAKLATNPLYQQHLQEIEQMRQEQS